MSDNGCRTILECAKGEIEEKRSRFLAEVRPVASEAEAQAFIAEQKKKYRDARHHCSAYVIGRDQEIVRSSDDGEPQGTAGHPMLDVLVREGLTDVAAVVTRYFGGVLLGSGGLVRAYSSALQEALMNCRIIEKKSGSLLEIRTDYSSAGKLQYYLESRCIPILKTGYAEDVQIEIILPTACEAGFLTEAAELMQGRGTIRKIKETDYTLQDGKVLL